MSPQAWQALPAAAEPSARSGRRLRLWEMEHKCHCSIVGTCLSGAELRKLAGKIRLALPEDATEYTLHVAFVGIAAEAGGAAKLVGKTLDRKFATQIARFAKAASEEELEKLWRDCRRDGDVAGGYWALMTHALPCQRLRERAYGEVHMLSHLAGAAGRADLKRLADFERQTGELARQLVDARRRATEEAARRIAVEKDLAAARAEAVRGEALGERLAELESGAALSELRHRLAATAAALDKAQRRADGAERRLVEREKLVDYLGEANLRLGRQIEAMTADLAAAVPQCKGDMGRDECPCLDLGGRRILYVGGVGRLMPRLEDLVGRCNGEFLHHDGGIEEGCGRLSGALARADAVLCPVTCVSHQAIDRVKKACRRCDKPFVPLHGTGLSSFLRALEALAEA